MSSDYDPAEFVDGDFQAHQAAPTGTQLQRAPTLEEVDTKVAAAQQRLAELKREKEEIERERIALEETRRRQMEFQTGRTEMIQNLTRGLGLLEEAEFSARRDAEQMAKALTELRQALDKVEATREETWTRENFSVELTRALTTLENARMEWNSARLKFPQLAAPAPDAETAPVAGQPVKSLVGGQSFLELCRLGLALTWPVATVVLALGAVLLLFLGRR
jgi:chromosome segregation ATPase